VFRYLELMAASPQEVADAAPILEVAGLSVDITVPTGVLHAVSDVSFTVGREETFSLVGESGCGKTMTALAIMGLLPRRAKLTAERIALEGQDLTSLSEGALADIRGERVAMIFQDATSALNPVFTIGSQLEDVYLRHKKSSRKEARERALYLLERLGITSPRLRLGQFPHELSGGMRQRMMIAMALMCEPTLVIADEPTTALDVTVQAQILQLLVSLQEEFKLSLILIAHDLGVVANVAHRMAVMYAGSIVETGTVEQVFSAPTHPYAQALMACIPRRGEPLGSIPGMVPTLVGELSGCMFRNRCQHVKDACSTTSVALTDIGAGHQYRCLIDAVELSQARPGAAP
jgi:peptide/nickel transport system ATP-binding protein